MYQSMDQPGKACQSCSFSTLRLNKITEPPNPALPRMVQIGLPNGEAGSIFMACTESDKTEVVCLCVCVLCVYVRVFVRVLCIVGESLSVCAQQHQGVVCRSVRVGNALSCRKSSIDFHPTADSR